MFRKQYQTPRWKDSLPSQKDFRVQPASQNPSCKLSEMQEPLPYALHP